MIIKKRSVDYNDWASWDQMAQFVFALLLVSSIAIIVLKPAPASPGLFTLAMACLILGCGFAFFHINKLRLRKVPLSKKRIIVCPSVFGSKLMFATLCGELLINGVTRIYIVWSEPFTEYGILIMLPLFVLCGQLCMSVSISRVRQYDLLNKMLVGFASSVTIAIMRVYFLQSEKFRVHSNGIVLSDLIFVLIIIAGFVNVAIIAARLHHNKPKKIKKADSI
ncbi:MAG: hypothetical protein FWG10_05020 [Eubacteriaceae bacterium]|nr:hypothetical protein [Eubacteriaceae bacterium]